MDLQGVDSGRGGEFSNSNNNYGCSSQGSHDQKKSRSYEEQTLIPITIGLPSDKIFTRNIVYQEIFQKCN